MKLPLVSIIIPCFNGERFIADAIKSALDQTYSKKEIIVIDDGSTDSSLEVIRSYGSAVRWEKQENQGASAARNRGLAIANGEVIQFLDADDLLKNTKVARQVPLLIENRDDIVFCRWESIFFDKRVADVHISPRIDVADPVALALAHIISTPTPLHWRKNLLDVGGFSTALACCQDYELHLRLACMGFRFYFHDEVLVTARRRMDGLSSNDKMLYSVWPGVYKSCYDMLLEREKMTPERAEAFAGRMALAGRTLLRLGEKNSALRCIREAYKMHSSGGIRKAYDAKSRLARSVLGAERAESAISIWRRFMKK